MVKKNWIYSISTWIISFFLANGGLLAIKEYPQFWPSGISLIVAAFLMVYFSSYTSQINKNKEDIQNCKDDLNKMKSESQLNEKVLNTIKDIVILNKSSRIK